MGGYRDSLKIWMAICCLGLTVFIFVSTSLLPIGLLPELASAFEVSQAYAGLLISGYAFASALLTLPLTMLCARLNRRTLLMALLMVFIASHVWSAAAQSFAELLISRLPAATAHAVLWGISTPTAVRLAPVGKGGRGLAVIGAGVALAAIAGVPLGTWLGHVLGWRAAFIAVAALAGLLMLILLALLPSLQSLNLAPLKNLSLLLKRPALLKIYVVVALLTIAHCAPFTFFTPFMRGPGGFSPEGAVALLWLFGLCGAVGSFVGGWQGGRAAVGTMALFIMAGNFVLAPEALNAGQAAVIIFCGLWGAAMSASTVLMQSEVFKAAPEATDLAMSLYAIFFNAGLGLGAMLGGAAFNWLGLGSITYVGAAFAGLAGLAHWLSKPHGS